MYIILLNKLWFDQISCSGKSNTHWRYEVPKWYEILERLRTSGFNAKTLVIDVVENWYLINVSRAWLSTNLTLRDWNCCWRLGGFTWTWTAWYFGHWTGFVDTMLLSEKRVALTWVSVCHSTLSFLNRTFRSELFGSRDFSILVVMVSKHFSQAMKSCRNLACLLFNANLLQSAEGFMEKKLQTWSKMQQLISINLWLSLSSASELNHYRHFAIKHKYFKLIITITNRNHGSSKGSWYNTS